jgi:hypothetical protein
MRSPEKISVYCERTNESKGVGAGTGNEFHPFRALQSKPLKITIPGIFAVFQGKDPGNMRRLICKYGAGSSPA